MPSFITYLRSCACQYSRNSAEIIISITHFGRICKCLDEKQPHPKVRLENKISFGYHFIAQVYRCILISKFKSLYIEILLII